LLLCSISPRWLRREPFELRERGSPFASVIGQRRPALMEE